MIDASRFDDSQIDIELADQARRALEQSPHLIHRHLRLESEHGRLRLRGTVHSYYQKQMAQQMLLSLEGVGSIENLLEVRCVD